ncbi:amidase [Rhizobiaceae bacterium n13]|uniref:Indoleacetamide hydrolase n=1 Tax=Ferirhizobium litorale TaxID=2927786 RepID=A0AAE3QKX6_9HYPH|nr:amidase [Fererhizobium litorale]MDI7865316.1 amidase [Fererhizobium litorale]MDI7925221.1 amidase [Fererhizobium litorale]
MTDTGQPLSAPEVSIARMLQDLSDRRTSSSELVGRSLASAHACQNDIRAFSEIDADGALAAAAACDENYASANNRQLEGIPVAVKDLFDTRGVPTRYGSAAYATHIPLRDARVVEALRDSGAVILGKTTTHEFAWGVTTASRNFGDTLNPIDRSRIPGGSSGGMAAAIAYGAVPVGLGTDTGGSVRIPAALCGVVGFKPSVGRLSTEGVFPFSFSLDHVGILGRTVDDACRLAAALGIKAAANRDPGRLRVGVVSCIGSVPMEPAVERAFAATCSKLALRHHLVPVINVGLFDDAFEAFAGIVLTEGGVVHFSRNDIGFIQSTYEAETASRLRLAEVMVLGDYARCQQARRRIQRQFSEQMRSFDLLLLPTCPCVAPRVGEDTVAIGEWTGTIREALMANTAPFNLTGNPAISIPIGLGNPGPLPVGLQIVAPLGRDEDLLRIASEFEALLCDGPLPGARDEGQMRLRG